MCSKFLTPGSLKFRSEEKLNFQNQSFWPVLNSINQLKTGVRIKHITISKKHLFVWGITLTSQIGI